MDANKFNSIKDRARKLIQMDNAGQIDEIAQRKYNNGEIGMDGDYPSYTPSESSQQLVAENYQEPPMNFSSPSSAKLPKEILESFKSNQIDTTAFNTEASILDKMNILPREARKPARKQINESVAPSTGNVDYSLIKSIVEEAVKKYMGAYTKKILTESIQNNASNSVNAIKIGDKFNFITDSGDLYEAKLVFKKNLKKK